MRLCKIKKCEKKHYAKNLCVMHFMRFRRTGSTKRKECVNENKSCKVKTCNAKAITKLYCTKHYARYKKHGSPFVVHKSKGRNVNGEKNPRWNGGVSYYPNHCEFKKIRKIVLKENPLCERCKKNKSVYAHHLDKSKTNHKKKNLVAVCTKRK